MDNSTLKEIIQLSKEKKPFCTVSKIDDSKVEIIISDKNDKSDLQKFVQDALSNDQLIIVDYKNNQFIINPYNPPLSLIIVGAVHITQYLSKMAKLLDFDVTIVDPREAFASVERFPDDKIINSWPEDCFKDIKIDSRTAIVTLTHEPSLDDPAITQALNSSCFYIGALGSKKTHNNRVQRLKEFGFSEDQIKKVNGPIGLPINAAKPNEIAISILSEIIAKLRHRNFIELELRDNWKLR